MSELRTSLRTLGRSPIFTLASATTLGLGIGGCVLLFSAVHASLLQPLSYPQPDRLVVVWGSENGHRRGQVSFTEMEDLRNDTEVFDELATFTEYRPLLSSAGGSERLVGGLVGDGFFRVLGVGPEAGRLFLPEEQVDGRDDVVLLTHGLWVRRFGADPSIVGSTVRLNLREHLVVGVLPADFSPLPSSLVDHRPDLYRPVAESYDPEELDSRHLRAVARLRPGVDLEEAQSAVDVVAERLAADHPEQSAGHRLRVVELKADAVAGYRQALLVLLIAVGLVLLVACANVAHLVLARMAPRRQELAVRASLGASQGRLARHLILESSLLAAAGAALGLAIARLGLELLRTLGDRYPLLERTALDPAVFLFAAVVTLLSVVGVSLLPAWQAIRTDPAAALTGGARVSGGGTRRALVVTEVAVATVLLVGSGLAARSLVALQRVEPGFDLEGKLTAGIWLPYSRYEAPAGRIAFFDRLLEAVEALPGVDSAAITSVLPLGDNFDRTGLEAQDRSFPPEDEPSPDRYVVSPGYLRMMGIRVLRGRPLQVTDREDAPPVVVVSQSLAARIWPGEDALGRRIRLPFSPAGDNPWRQVVGIVADVRQYGLDQPASPAIYLPYAQYPFTYVTLVTQGPSEPAIVAAPIVAAARRIDPDQALFDIATGRQLLRRATGQQRLPSIVLSSFALVVLAMAAIGLFGVLALSVTERTREIGVRLALGARRQDVARSVILVSARLLLLGLGLGLAVAWPAVELLRGLLFGIEPHDLASFALAPSALALAALVAAWIPVRRAAGVDPMAALRAD